MRLKIWAEEVYIDVTREELVKIKNGSFIRRLVFDDEHPTIGGPLGEQVEAMDVHMVVFKGIDRHYANGSVDWDLVCVEGDLAKYIAGEQLRLGLARRFDLRKL